MTHISLGENCLTQDLLQRQGLTNDSSVFSYMHSNIRLINLILADEFEHFINNHLFYKYRDSHLELVHHNVKTRRTQASFKRKIERFQNTLKSNDIVFWYHHRERSALTLDDVFDAFEEFDQYSQNDAKYIILRREQKTSEKRFEHTNISKFNLIKCFDDDPWKGKNYAGKTFYNHFNFLLNEYNLLNKL